MDVIYGEFLLREELGERPELQEYQLRFPTLSDALQDQIEFHRTVAADAPSRIVVKETGRTASSTPLVSASVSRLPAHLTHSVPGYEILSELGRGGMGIVYQARQLSLNRLVALKMLRAGDCGSAALLARFQAEAEAVARLHHPNIVQIYDYGEHDGMPYLALELVEGGPLSADRPGERRTPREAAEMIVTLARAVQFAHEQGIVHRDLKLANVLMTALAADHSLGGGTIKITDFGLAKVLRKGEEIHTQTGTIVGTPSYMAPEQVRGNSLSVGPASDVYALGAILYELLTGQPPFKSLTAIDTLHQVLTIEAVSPTRHVPNLPRDLATIVIKCLQKDPQRRYGSAADLANDLERFLEDRPIRARPVSAAEQIWRWCRRNPMLASLTGSVAILLVVVAAVSLFYSLRLNHELAATSTARQAEGDARKLAELRLWESYLAELRARRGSQRIGRRTESLATVDRACALLDKIGRTPERVLQLRNAVIAALALPDLREERIVSSSPGACNVSLSFAADRYARTGGGAVTVHRLSDDALLCRIPRDSTVRPDGIGPGISADGRFVSVDTIHGVRIWRCDGEQATLVGHWPGATHVAMTPDCRQAVISHPADGVRLVELATGQPVKQLLQRGATARPAFHRASKRVAICTNAGVSIIDCQTGQSVGELPVESRGGIGIAWHPNGEVVAISGLSEGVELWDVASRRMLIRCPHRGIIRRPNFNSDGSLLLTQSDWTGELRVWNTGTGQEVLHSGFTDMCVSDASGSPGDFLLKLNPEALTLWRIVPGLAANPLLDAPHDSRGDVTPIAVSPDGRVLAIGRSFGFDLWDLATRRRTSHSASPRCGAAFAPNGDLLIACRWGLYRWPRQATAQGDDRRQGPCGYRFGPPEKLSGTLRDVEISTSRDGHLVAVNASTGWQIHRLGDSNQVTRMPWKEDIRGISINPDGGSVSFAKWDDAGVEVWSTRNVRRIVDLQAGRHGIPLFSPDGRWLAATPDGVRLWKTDEWKPGPKLHAHGDTPSGLGFAFSPDSKVLAVSQPDESTRLVDPETGIDWAELWRPDAHPTPHPYLSFTPDQSRLIETPWDGRGMPRIWDLVAIRQELARFRLDWPADVLKVDMHQPMPAGAIDAAITLDEGNLPNRGAAADLIEKAGYAKDDQARKSLEQAIQLDPESADAHNNLAWVLVAGPESLRNAREAVRLARRAVQLERDVASHWNTLGVALYRVGQYSEAIDALNRSLERGGDDAAGYDLIFLALCHSRMGNATVADDFYHRALRWHEQRHSRLSPHSRDELNSLFAEAKAAGLPKKAPTN